MVNCLQKIFKDNQKPVYYITGLVTLNQYQAPNLLVNFPCINESSTFLIFKLHSDLAKAADRLRKCQSCQHEYR